MKTELDQKIDQLAQLRTLTKAAEVAAWAAWPSSSEGLGDHYFAAGKAWRTAHAADALAFNLWLAALREKGRYIGDTEETLTNNLGRDEDAEAEQQTEGRSYARPSSLKGGRE